MRFDNLKEAFGSTPESIKECVQRSLREDQRREPVMRRKMTLSLAVALAAILLIGCVGFAATQLEGIAGIFGYTDSETGETIVNEAVLKHIEALNETYAGKAVRFNLTEALVSSGNISLAWTLEPVNEGEQFYVLCNNTVGGKYLDMAMLDTVTEFILDGVEQCALSGRVSGENLLTELKFSIMKLNGEPTRISGWDDENETEDEFWARMEALIAEGKIPMAGDGVIEVRPSKDMTYAEELVAAGAAELVEEFTVTVDLNPVKAVDEHRLYEGVKSFSFDGFEIQIVECVVTPADTRIIFDYICDKQLTEVELDELLMGFVIGVPGVETWAMVGTADYELPVQLEDGRWKVTITGKVMQQVIYPEELILSLAEYDAEGNPTPLTGEGILLKLTDK